MNLYQLTGQYQLLEQAIMLNPDDAELQAEIMKIEDDIESKADNYAKLIKNLQADMDALKKESDRLRDRYNRFDYTVNRLKENLKESMQITGKTKFKTELFSFGVVNNGGKLPLIVHADVELPEELTKVIVEPDNEKIRAYIDETGDLTYAEYGERGTRLSIK